MIQVLGSHSGAVENLGFLGYDALSLCDSFLVFQRKVLPLNHHELVTECHSITSQKT